MYCAFSSHRSSFDKEGTQDLPTRRRAAESRGLDLGRQTGACAPHRPPSLLRQLCHYVRCCCVAKQRRAPLDAG
ncbi:jg7757 [Pararge aegeria aegeria]|uniref:Jg7757 protein n=1 Tax=Pararge aegeria aegeria TaxID=348720 RepID=A0A8S4S3C8_9NEOP|nr:jg7757 [Pararge aegeria aegeria]